MKRPDFPATPVGAALALLALLLGAGKGTAEEAESFDSWYRTEVLIFVRTQADEYASEQWDFEPTVAYPGDYRYLIDTELAEERRIEAGAYESRIDELGYQSLLVPAAVTALLDHERPDAYTIPPDIPLDPNSPYDPNSPFDPDVDMKALLPGGPNSPLAAFDDSSDPDQAAALAEPAFREVQVEIPYRLLERDELEFTAQARSLQRRGHKIAFHGSWWAPLTDKPETLPIALDRGADPDAGDWPELQGSLLVYRSRYLHIALDLWLNTMGDYLPDGWQIEAPPLPQPTVYAETLRGEVLDPWAPALVADSFADASPELSTAGSVIGIRADVAPEPPTNTVEEDPEALPDETLYPWRHLIVHRQSRRMRSGEVHYLDHPIIGVIVKVTPVSDELQPYAEPEETETEFRQRHQLPDELLQLPLEDITDP